MYLGEVHISNENLKDFIRVAEALQIRGLSKDTSTTDEDEEFEHKRSNDGDHLFTTQSKKLKILNEGSIANVLNDDDIDDDLQSSRIQAKRETVQPKTESLEFLEDVQNIQQQAAMIKQQPHNITYMNMDTFPEKTNTVTNQPPSSAHHVTNRKIITQNFSFC